MSVIHENLEPGVINTDLLRKLTVEQGPQGEAGRLFLSDGIVLNEVKAIRLEYLNILRIDNLWMMTSLVKLHLGINIIEKIENLDALVNLIELDLSFNNIEIIENINKLNKLEIFTIFQNKISKIENMEALTRLRLFNIGNNKIEDWENVIYLRQFPSLRSLNMAGNPCTKHASFIQYVFAFLPQLTYYEYRYIPPNAREEACIKYRKPLTELEEIEGKIKQEKCIEEEYQHRQEMYAEAFVENLDRDQFFLAMFEKDEEGNALLKMGDEAIELYNEYHDSFCVVINKLFELGLEHQKIRQEEIRQYKQCFNDIKEENAKEIEKLMGAFFEKKAHVFMLMKTAIRGIETMDLDQKHHYEQIEKCTEEFSALCQNVWNKLMAGEAVTADQLEESNALFERNINDLVATFIEAAQTLFTECRNLQQGFNEQLSEIGNRYITNINIKTDSKVVVPKELQAIIVDREALVKAMTGTQDVHMQVIDGREDQLVTRIRSWASTMCEEIHKNEMTRNRSKIKEFNHFADVQCHEFEILHSRLHDM